MTIIERKSERKKKAIMMLVESQEYSIAYAMMLAEELNDQVKLLDNDYEELMEWLEAKLNPPTPEPEETPIENKEVVEDDTNID